MGVVLAHAAAQRKSFGGGGGHMGGAGNVSHVVEHGAAQPHQALPVGLSAGLDFGKIAHGFVAAGERCAVEKHQRMDALIENMFGAAADFHCALRLDFERLQRACEVEDGAVVAKAVIHFAAQTGQGHAPGKHALVRQRLRGEAQALDAVFDRFVVAVAGGVVDVDSHTPSSNNWVSRSCQP